jgi:hypothetical protein
MPDEPVVVARASSFESLQDAIDTVLSETPAAAPIEYFGVLLSVERGGFVGRVQYHAALTAVAELP